MTDLEKSRAQRDAQRSAARRRPSGPTTADEAIIRHLGVEFYKESHQAARTPKTPAPIDTDEKPSDEPADQ
ncbi:hypothetical protein [Kribbella shirazensis]|uniref:Uncharacterized protein n=1 Tax=Kribbella shirazensis TaxID=1105143 RepID=A0A7X6A2D7_9ACTN|nr:hypothetical protein [Kribbella shirazensis]NIK59166.1 hypothetical protein [Kribbella shirazensis]